MCLWSKHHPTMLKPFLDNEWLVQELAGYIRVFPICNLAASLVVPCQMSPSVLDSVKMLVRTEPTCPDMFWWPSLPFIRLCAVTLQRMFRLEMADETLLGYETSAWKAFDRTNGASGNRSVSTLRVFFVADWAVDIRAIHPNIRLAVCCISWKMLLFLVLLPSRLALEWAFVTNSAAPFYFFSRLSICFNSVAG